MTSQKETSSDLGTSYHNVLIQIISGILVHTPPFHTLSVHQITREITLYSVNNLLVSSA